MRDAQYFEDVSGLLRMNGREKVLRDQEKIRLQRLIGTPTEFVFLSAPHPQS